MEAEDDEGPHVVTILWALTALTFVFVVFRLYARLSTPNGLGLDDHVYNLAFTFMLIFTSTTTVSECLGYWKNDGVMDSSRKKLAIITAAISEAFLIFGMSLAKCSLGIFLFRLTRKTWHLATIWAVMILLMASSFALCFAFLVGCAPGVPVDKCHAVVVPAGVTLGVICTLADFFFAVCPWFFLWDIPLEKGKKMSILISLSLGVIAGGCGIKRTTEVPKVTSNLPTNGIIIWSAAEIAATMVCIAIPMAWTLLRSALGYSTARSTGRFSNQPVAAPITSDGIERGGRESEIFLAENGAMPAKLDPETGHSRSSSKASSKASGKASSKDAIMEIMPEIYNK